MTLLLLLLLQDAEFDKIAKDPATPILDVRADGKIEIKGKTYFDPARGDWSALDEYFEKRRDEVGMSGEPGLASPVRSVLLLRVRPAVRLDHVQRILSKAGMPNVAYQLTSDEKNEAVQFLRWDLQSKKGDLGVANPVDEKRVRVVLCADPKSIADHIDPGHAPASAKEVVLRVDVDGAGKAVKLGSDWLENLAEFDQAAEAVKKVDKAAVIVDADGAVPFEHVFGLVSMLQKHKVAGVRMRAAALGKPAKVVDVEKTRMVLIAVRSALDKYEMDTGRYPESLDDLIQPKVPPKGWKGPYVRDPVPRDLWGRPYVYRVTPKGFELLSLGPDGNEGTADDIRLPQ
jgi:general secretion pathway protein G